MVIITEKTLKKLVKEFLITIGLLSIATVIGMLLIYIGFTESNVIIDISVMSFPCKQPVLTYEHVFSV